MHSWYKTGNRFGRKDLWCLYLDWQLKLARVWKACFRTVYFLKVYRDKCAYSWRNTCVCVWERIRGRGERLREFVWGRECDGDRAFSSLCVCVCVLVNAQQCSSSQPPSRKNPIILCIPHKFQLGFHLLAPLLHPFPLSLPPKASSSSRPALTDGDWPELSQSSCLLLASPLTADPPAPL